MTQPKPTIPEVLDRFAEYIAKPGNGAWGSLHIVLEDLNVKDDSVKFCVGWAEEHGDTEGAELARILLRMSKTQRRKIGPMARKRADDGMRPELFRALAEGRLTIKLITDEEDFECTP